jgi:hypothetical protein
VLVHLVRGKRARKETDGQRRWTLLGANLSIKPTLESFISQASANALPRHNR